MAKKIFFGNYKGGVGKTTSTYQIAYELFQRYEKNVLLLDLDPQSSLSGICMNKCHQKLDDTEEIKFIDNYGVIRTKSKLSFKTLNYVYALYMQARMMNNIKFTIEYDKIVLNIDKLDKPMSLPAPPRAAQTIFPMTFPQPEPCPLVPSQPVANTVPAIAQQQPRLDFIPNSLFSEYGGLDKISIEVGKSIENLLVLRDFIEDNKLNDRYDYILFDCPPSNNIITQSAFLYCDYYIIPTIMDELSVKGVTHYISVIEKIYADYCVNHDHADVLSLVFGKKPQLIGIFETMRKGRSDTGEAQRQLKDAFEEEGSPYRKFIFESEIKDINAIADETGKGNKCTGDGHSDWIKSGDKVGYGPVTSEMLEFLAKLEQRRV